MAKRFPTTLLEFQQMFPDERTCGAYLERVRWPDGFACPWCGAVGAAYRFENRPTVLRCRACRRNTYLTAGTVMHATRTPLQVWFWGAYLVTTQTPGISALQFQRQLGLSRYETAFQMLHKLRASLVRPDRDRIGKALPMIPLIFSNLKAWLLGTHHGVSAQHLPAYLNEFVFRFNRRFYPMTAFASALGIGTRIAGPTYDALYGGHWVHPGALPSP